MTRVGYKLYREVRDLAPEDWSPSELVVAWLIADDANDDTRQSWIPLPLLCAYARLKPSSVRAALAKMAAGGHEFRVCHGYGKDGRPVFAAKGHAVNYAVPDMTIAATRLAPMAAVPVDNPPQSRQVASAYTNAKALANEPKALANGLKGASTLAPFPSVPSVSPQLKKRTSSDSPVEGTQPCG